MFWPSGEAQSNTHLKTMTVYDEEEEEEVWQLEDDYNHNDGVLSPRGQCIIYLFLAVRSGPVQHALEYNDSIGGGGWWRWW